MSSDEISPNQGKEGKEMESANNDARKWPILPSMYLGTL
jgi:hypothetical protein